MAAISGKFGNVKIGSTALFELTKWTFTRKVAVHKYASNATNGFKKAVAGVKDGSGSLGGEYDSSNRIDTQIDVGDSVTLLLYTTASQYYTVPSMISELTFNVDLMEGEIVNWEGNYETDGEWTEPV